MQVAMLAGEAHWRLSAGYGALRSVESVAGSYVIWVVPGPCPSPYWTSVEKTLSAGSFESCATSTRNCLTSAS